MDNALEYWAPGKKTIHICSWKNLLFVTRGSRKHILLVGVKLSSANDIQSDMTVLGVYDQLQGKLTPFVVVDRQLVLTVNTCIAAVD